VVDLVEFKVDSSAFEFDECDGLPQWSRVGKVNEVPLRQLIIVIDNLMNVRVAITNQVTITVGSKCKDVFFSAHEATQRSVTESFRIPVVITNIMGHSEQ
jgi:hypothetical protein